MITSLEEIRRLRRLLNRAAFDLRQEGKPFRLAPLGIMLEVPAAALTIDTMLPLVDFVSIGTNDLVQYLMAADRDNPKVSHLCQPLSPAVLRVLRNVIAACRQRNHPVTVCGEMAGQPRSFMLLLGMGLRSFSMSPAFIPSVKELASHLTVPRAEAILKHALRLTTSGQIKRFMSRQLGEISPKLKLLDTP
jgi:phosphotransferase system enzyme I (PtsI)